MINTIINEDIHTQHKITVDENDKNKPKNIASTQKENAKVKSNESIVTSHIKSENDHIDLRNEASRIVAPSIVSRESVLDIADKLFPDAFKKSKWPQIFFRNLLRRNIKSPRQFPHQKFMQSRKIKTWVQFSFYDWFWSEDDDEEYEILDYNPESRNNFVKIVFSIVGGMLLITAIFVAIVYNVSVMFEIFHKPSLFIYIFSLSGGFLDIEVVLTCYSERQLYIILSGGLMIVYFLMLCFKFSRSSPWCYIILVLTVLFASFVAAIITCRYETHIILYAFASAAGVVGTCIGLACTRFDFTSFWLYLIVISSATAVLTMCIMFGMMMTKVYLKPLHITIIVISVILHAVALIMELQMILGGKSIQIGENDYALAAFMLYTSIVDIFIKILQICGISNQ